MPEWRCSSLYQGLRRFNRKYGGERMFHTLGVIGIWIAALILLLAMRYWQQILGFGLFALGGYLLWSRIAEPIRANDETGPDLPTAEGHHISDGSPTRRTTVGCGRSARKMARLAGKSSASVQVLIKLHDWAGRAIYVYDLTMPETAPDKSRMRHIARPSDEVWESVSAAWCRDCASEVTYRTVPRTSAGIPATVTMCRCKRLIPRAEHRSAPGALCRSRFARVRSEDLLFLRLK
jgi:hypothetical protein